MKFESKKVGLYTLGAAALAGLAWGTFFLVPEGHIGVITQFSAAVRQVPPGLHFKIPIINAVKKIEVREKKNVETLNAATKNQLPVTAEISINWSVNPEATLSLFKKYGTLQQFEDRVLDPKIRQAAKDALPKFNADELIRNRNGAVQIIMANLVDLLEGYPVTVRSPQIEDLTLPQQYMDAVMSKEKERESAQRELYALEKQKLQAQQEVQSAEASKEATKKIADGQAYKTKTEAAAEAEAIRLRGQAEAAAIEAVEQALAGNSLYVQYLQARAWNGQLPQTMIPGGSVPFLNITK
jgi:regulator of protease activity HflC (stomatin/prohibitin superfamily)